MKNIQELVSQIEKERNEINTDSYSMSIGEIINLYKEGELELTPAYQRLFRWNDDQKSRFIESILLGIPIPPIFVAQKEDSTWSVVDGVQRISTILQFIGELPNYPPLVLKAGSKLPFMEGFSWESLSLDIRRSLRREKFGVNIIKTNDNIESQYELFQRLNTGGTFLTPQEIRNCLIIMLNEDFYEKLNELKKYPAFLSVISLPERKIKEEYHMELILRYFISRRNKTDFESYSLSSITVPEFFDKETTKLILDSDFNLDEEIVLFKSLMDYLFSSLGIEASRKYVEIKDLFEGGFSNACFEMITAGPAINFDKVRLMDPKDFRNFIVKIYKHDKYKTIMKHGKRALQRYKECTLLSIEEFSNYES